MLDLVQAARARIEAAAGRAGRDPALVRIVAITKGHPASSVKAALAAGIDDIGENRVQEASAKRQLLPRDAGTWHLVGHLQHNKAATAARLFDSVDSVDSVRVAQALADRRGPGAPLAVLVQVDITDIPSRTGATPAVASEVLRAALALPQLRPVGLMTIAPQGPPDAARRCFAALRQLRERLSTEHCVALPELSMGMSDDFEVAVEEGATMVRLGRVLFGERPPLS